MPIKTIQPFVSDFNAFAGEGFYGNVVQGLVIKQLEDVVFIFGIAIDGTLIFRKRNYPDVSTWEDPKIIIHSNNWHKIYSKRELGGLLPIASENKNGLMSAYYSQSITRMNGYSEGTSMSLAKLPIGFSYLNVVDSSDFPSKSGAVLKFKFGGTMYLQGWFMNGFYVRCIRDGVDTGWKKIATS